NRSCRLRSLNQQCRQRARKHPSSGGSTQRRSTGLRVWNNKQSSNWAKKEDEKEKSMETNTAQEKSTRVASSGEQNGLTRLTFSNPQQRSEHVQAFLEWLPRMLHEAPTIHWESLPSIVKGYLIRHV